MQPDYWPDLRQPRTTPAPDDSPWFLWSSPRMVELTALDSFRFVQRQLPAPPARVLEVGCGSGWLALEIARLGHAVTALESDEDASDLARRVAESASGLDPSRLALVNTSFEDWSGPKHAFDVAVFHLSLHHLGDLDLVFERLQQTLATGGRIVCVEFAYDRLDAATAAWLHEQEVALLPEPSAPTPAALREAWMAHFQEHELHGHDAMLSGLRAVSRRRMYAESPYLFVSVGNRLPAEPPDIRDKRITQLKDMEAQALAGGRIQGVQFRYVGEMQS